MAILLAKSNRFKAEDVKNGQSMTILGVADWVTDNYKQSDGSSKSVSSLVAMAKVGEIEKEYRFVKGSRENFIEAFGNDTAKWVGKSGLITLVPTEKGKSILLSPIVAASEVQWKD